MEIIISGLYVTLEYTAEDEEEGRGTGSKAMEFSWQSFFTERRLITGIPLSAYSKIRPLSPPWGILSTFITRPGGKSKV